MFLDHEWLMQQGPDAMLLHAVGTAFARRPDTVAVAVSGGGDSMALLDLAIRAAAQQNQTVLAVTVDHGLRPEAAEEARMVAAFCAERSIHHDTLRWDGQADGNLMAAAREARYRLIAQWALDHDCAHVILGHTQDDEAETFLMSLARGAGVNGLAGMDLFPVYGGVRWRRPLMSVPRAELREYLTRRNIKWVDDPTNDNDKYLRVRTRKLLPQLDAIGLNADQISSSVHAMKMARSALEHYTIKEADEYVTVTGGDVILPRNFNRVMPVEIQRRLWVAILQWIGGGQYAPRTSALFELDTAILDGRNHTLNGCAVIMKDDKIHVTRELNAVRDLTCATDEIWDRRWRMDGPHDPALTIAPVGEAGIRQLDDWRSAGFSRSSIISSPAVWDEKTLIAAPLAGFNDNWTAQIVAPWHPVAKHALNL